MPLILPIRLRAHKMCCLIVEILCCFPTLCASLLDFQLQQLIHLLESVLQGIYHCFEHLGLVIISHLPYRPQLVLYRLETRMHLLKIFITRKRSLLVLELVVLAVHLLKKHVEAVLGGAPSDFLLVELLVLEGESVDLVFKFLVLLVQFSVKVAALVLIFLELVLQFGLVLLP